MSNKKRCYALTGLMQGRGHDVDIDSNSQGLRIENKTGSRSISPRLRPVEMIIWLSGYQAALDEVERIKQENLRQLY